MARALALQVLDDTADQIVEKWSLARNLLGQPDRKLRTSAIKDIWLVLVDVLNEDRFTLRNRQLSAPLGAIVRACVELKATQKIDVHTWRNLVGNSRDILAAPERMQGSREERVMRFENALAALSQNVVVEPNLASFISGYLASLIDPSSFSYTKLVLPLLDRFPTVMLWYGLCAGFQQRNDLLSQFNALGRRVLRDIAKPESPLGRPSSDISVDELEVFMRGDKQFRDFHRSSPKHISIEILPMISMSVNWPDRSTKEPHTLVESKEHQDFEFVARQLSQAIQSLNQIHTRLLGSQRRHLESVPSGKVFSSTVTKGRGKRRKS
jgi:hypothetical protein